jgi:hypothetical protein
MDIYKNGVYLNGKFFTDEEIITMALEEQYINTYRIQTDIKGHLPILRYYSSLCESVTEMGTYFGKSTIAFLAGKPKKLRCYDLIRTEIVDNIEKLAKEVGVDYLFITGDSLKVDIEQTDLLFIDTLHTYVQLNAELNRHADKVNKYIIMHDTTTYDLVDSPNRYRMGDKPQGLWTAIKEFVDQGFWKEKERIHEYNGLTVLERI